MRGNPPLLMCFIFNLSSPCFHCTVDIALFFMLCLSIVPFVARLSLSLPLPLSCHISSPPVFLKLFSTSNLYSFIVLYCIVLYCIVLYCIVLYCIVLYCIVLYCIVLYCIVLYCIVLYCVIPISALVLPFVL